MKPEIFLLKREDGSVEAYSLSGYDGKGTLELHGEHESMEEAKLEYATEYTLFGLFPYRLT